MFSLLNFLLLFLFGEISFSSWCLEQPALSICLHEKMLSNSLSVLWAVFRPRDNDFRGSDQVRFKPICTTEGKSYDVLYYPLYLGNAQRRGLIQMECSCLTLLGNFKLFPKKNGTFETIIELLREIKRVTKQ